MADFVQLLEDDVAEAKLDTENLNKYAVTVLERWLQCRGLARNGSKSVLIKRILNHVKAGDSHILNPGVDCGKPLEAKKRCLIEGQEWKCDDKEAYALVSSECCLEDFPNRTSQSCSMRGMCTTTWWRQCLRN